MDDLPQRSLADKRGPQVLSAFPRRRRKTIFYEPTASVHMQLAVRTREKPEVVIPEIRGLLGQLAPQLRGLKIETMDQVVEDSMGDQNLAAHLLELFGGTALIITLAGLYGSLLYAVSLRRREMAVRLAVGCAARRYSEDRFLARGDLAPDRSRRGNCDLVCHRPFPGKLYL